jgi:Zn-dependent protease
MSIIGLLILIVSIVAHEVAHGVAALWQGDPTAKHARRLTLNPIPHIDLVGSIIVPLLCAMISPSIMFGWAKPVPINPYNFRNHRWGEALVSFAGPATNMAIALVFSAVIHFVPVSAAFINFAAVVIIINIVLALFNMMPIPPLDGSKILFSVIPQRFHGFKRWMEEKGFVISLVVVLFLWQFFVPLVEKLFVMLVS